MTVLHLPPATAAVREQARLRCALPYRSAQAVQPLLLDSSFADVVAGSATIVVYVDQRGRPIAADIVRASDDSFMPAALQRLAQWRYRPATCGGRPVPGKYLAIFNG